MSLKRIKVTKLKILKNQKGDLLKYLTKKDKYFKSFGEIYFNEIKKNQVKGWNFHKKCQCLLSVPYGRVQFTFADKIDPNFYKWIVNNPSKVKVGDTCLESIKKGQYVRGFYCYIKDDKILSLIHLMIGAQIARIDNIVYKAVKDK